MVILLIPRSATNLWLCKLFGSKAAFSAFFVLCSKAEQETRNVFNNFTAYRLGKFLLDVAWRYCPLFYFENASEMLGEPRVSSLQIFDCRNFVCKNSTERIKKTLQTSPLPPKKDLGTKKTKSTSWTLYWKERADLTQIDAKFVGHWKVN